jgi:hypothetical protein
MKVYAASLYLLFVTAAVSARPNVVPSLHEWTDGTGMFTIDNGSRICVDPAFTDSLVRKAGVFRDDLADITGKTLAVVLSSAPSTGDFLLTMNCTDTGIGRQGYLFEVGTSAVIRARTANGVIFGTRTALQILKQDSAKSNIPQGTARDYPQWGYRGFLIDDVRKFQTFYFLKEYIKLLSWYKMSDFHLHLSDQYAFRLQSDNYPALTAGTTDFYTKAQIRELDSLAVDYGVSITPEIDMPGHAYWLAEKTNTAQYDCNGIRNGQQGALDLANPLSDTVRRKLIEEFLPMFHGPDFSVGGDEYPTNSSSADANHNLLMQSPSLVSKAASIGHSGYPDELYRKFLNDCNKQIKQMGKRARIWSWDFAVKKDPNGSIPLDTDQVYDIYMPGDVHDHIKKGMPILNSCGSLLYLIPSWSGACAFQSQYMYEKWNPLIINSDQGNITANKPDLDHLSAAEAGHLIGAKLNIWQDNANYSEALVENMTRPCLAVLSEVLWGGPKSASYDAFRIREKAVGKPPRTTLFDKPDNFFEAEAAALLGGAQTYVDVYASDGQAVKNINAGQAGVRFSNVRRSKKMEISYCGASAGSLGLYVNNTFIKNIVFPKTSADVWNWYKIVTTDADIPAGATVEFRFSNSGYANLDYAFFIPVDTLNLAFEKPVTGSATIKNAAFINDGSANVDNYGDLGSGLQWITIDLGRDYTVDSMQLWHFFRDARQYHDIIVQLSSSSDFSGGVTTVFNNDADNSAQKGKGTDVEYAETNAGRSITFNQVSARYVRLYSKGNSVDANNYYSEVQVFAANQKARASPHPIAAPPNLSVKNRNGTLLIDFNAGPGDRLINATVYNCAGRCVFSRAFDGRQSGPVRVRWKASAQGKVGNGTYIAAIKTNRRTIHSKITDEEERFERYR